MYIIKLDAINSTNSYLKEMSLSSQLKDFTVVVANEQTEGRGQMGTTWQSERSKNLMLSIFREVTYLNVKQQYYLSIITALSIYTTLLNYHIPNLTIKWPNDILSDNKKIAGILIENIVKSNNLTGTIIGMGINVNQLDFSTLPQASSIQSITGKAIELDELLYRLLNNIRVFFQRLQMLDFSQLKKEYESLLFGIDKESTFSIGEDIEISGMIKGINNQGKLKVLLSDGQLKTFDLKEIKLLN